MKTCFVCGNQAPWSVLNRHHGQCEECRPLEGHAALVSLPGLRLYGDTAYGPRRDPALFALHGQWCRVVTVNRDGSTVVQFADGSLSTRIAAWWLRPAYATAA